jgi:Mg-chelatase subunit ChlI
MWPRVAADGDRMAAAVVRTIDQHAAYAGLAHFTESDFLRTVSHQERLRSLLRRNLVLLHLK